MRPNEVMKSLETMIEIGQPVFIWGAPGVGKTSIVKQVSEKTGRELQTIIATLLDPVDLRGLPNFDKEREIVKWFRPVFLPTKNKTILFFDDLPTAPPLVQAACYELILENRVGEHILPPDTAKIAAGNRETDRALVNRIPTPLANRFVHINFEVNTEDWVEWGYRNGITNEVIGFIKYRPNLLFNFDPQKNEKSFPTPRSWEMVSKILKAGNENYELIAGAIGEGPATEFVSYLKLYKTLPDIDIIFTDPEKATVPSEPALLYAVVTGIVPKVNKKNFKNVMKYAERIPGDFSVLLIKDIAKIHEFVFNTPEFETWAKTHADIII